VYGLARVAARASSSRGRSVHALKLVQGWQRASSSRGHGAGSGCELVQGQRASSPHGAGSGCELVQGQRASSPHGGR
jgi:hypothetical protein